MKYFQNYTDIATDLHTSISQFKENADSGVRVFTAQVRATRRAHFIHTLCLLAKN